MNYYLTFNDSPSGVYNSQVIDVINFLNKQGHPTRLVAFISLRGFAQSKTKITFQCPDAIVIPMFPGVKNWYLNRFVLLPLLWILKPESVMARGVFATRLADFCRKYSRRFRLIFDARGAYFAEFSEHRLIEHNAFITKVKQLEAHALRQSDAQLAVSNALVQYWKDQYEYEAGKKVRVIPCTLAESHNTEPMTNAARRQLRHRHEITDDEVVLVYSGSAAGWQSLDALMSWLAPLMKKAGNLKLLLMTPVQSLAGTPLEIFSDRILLKWVAPEQVHELLAMADYGLLLRNASITNKVASPTKFGEYLAVGLRVLISPDIGDFSEFVAQHHCGKIISGDEMPALHPLTEHAREHSILLSRRFFSKSQYTTQYNELIKAG